MTTPSGQISMSDVRLEIYGSGSGQINMNDLNVHQLAGVANSAAISMSQLKSQTWDCTYVPAGTTASNSAVGSVTLVFTTSRYVTWSYILNSGSAGTVSQANNSISNNITFTLAPGTSGRVNSYTLTATAGKLTHNWNLTLQADASGGGVMTL